MTIEIEDPKTKAKTSKVVKDTFHQKQFQLKVNPSNSNSVSIISEALSSTVNIGGMNIGA